MELEQIIIQTSDFMRLQKDIENGLMAKATLLVSQDLRYSDEFAQCLASLIFNDGKYIDNENMLKVKAGAHPDFKVYPEKERLMVADSDNIVEENSLRPIFANKKIILIRNIDIALEQAQNKLLKTLEEPANSVYFILTTTSLEKVLPTIRSRCNKIELAKLSPSVIKDMCGGDILIAALCNGFAGKALELLERPDLRNLYNSVLSCVTQMKNSKSLLNFSKKLLAFKDNFNLIMETFSIIFEDILFIKTGKPNCVRLKEQLQELQAVEGEYTITAINEIRKLLDNATKEMTYNCNFTIVMENLLLNILEVKYICR